MSCSRLRLVACGSDNSGGGGDEKAQGDAKELKGKIAVLLPDTKSSDRWEKADRRFFDEAFKAAGLSSDDFIDQATRRAIRRTSARRPSRRSPRARR